ncbi:MAG TPA: ATP-binding protein [Phycisphaerae bacterium]|nr:ATP-binding protein [Phycisphaerae bacterium]HNU44748.1 ATP-binding protein [Phycisphaerae bacterium]
MQTIQATVNTRLLTKADRLFTGTLDGRIIELLQNARRAGATKVTITNEDGWVTVKDNGQGIDDFARLLDLGGSGWDERCEQSEDPAGVGIFCLAPRKVTIRSKSKIVTISKDGWTHKPVHVLKDPNPVKKGTILRFRDEPWEPAKVDVNAVFSGLQVSVDGKRCPKLPFVSAQAARHPDLGCTIEVRTAGQLDAWHHSCRRERWYGNNVLVNFHGQVVTFDDHPVSEQGLYYLVDLTGEPTGIRLMLPARTRLVENEAYQQLLAALELEAYRYLERKGEHTLPYKEFLRAKDLGICLPEAKPTFTVGLIGNDLAPEPVEVVMPKDFPLAKCYRFDLNAPGQEGDDTNAHLLAALGTFPEPFVPVSIRSGYDGYSWATLPTIGKVEVTVGKELHRACLWSGNLTCVDTLAITAHTSDGKVFSAPVCMAKAPPKDASQCSDDEMLVTPEAQQRWRPSEIWYHLGGWYDDGDTYDTQLYAFERDLSEFWANLIGPDEQLRQSILAPLDRIQPERTSVRVTPDGRVQIEHVDGSVKTIQPPTPTATA